MKEARPSLHQGLSVAWSESPALCLKMLQNQSWRCVNRQQFSSAFFWLGGENRSGPEPVLQHMKTHTGLSLLAVLNPCRKPYISQTLLVTYFFRALSCLLITCKGKEFLVAENVLFNRGHLPPSLRHACTSPSETADCPRAPNRRTLLDTLTVV